MPVRNKDRRVAVSRYIALARHRDPADPTVADALREVRVADPGAPDASIETAPPFTVSQMINISDFMRVSS